MSTDISECVYKIIINDNTLSMYKSLHIVAVLLRALSPRHRLLPLAESERVERYCHKLGCPQTSGVDHKFNESTTIRSHRGRLFTHV